jgi:hypothetical protein
MFSQNLLPLHFSTKICGSERPHIGRARLKRSSDPNGPVFSRSIDFAKTHQGLDASIDGVLESRLSGKPTNQKWLLQRRRASLWRWPGQFIGLRITAR